MSATPNVVNPVAAVDQAFWIIYGVSAVILVLITAAMIWFVYRYDRKRHPTPATFDGSLVAETIWTVVPTALVMGMFYYGWTSYVALRSVPPDAMPVRVTARMWSWSFEYPSGKKSPVLYAPVGKAVRLNLKSVDVIHGFYAPAFRIKVDTVPGMPTNAWFRAEKPGSHDVFCSVYCGLRHADMITKIEAVPPEEFEKWLASAQTGSPGKVALEKHGCLSCHSLDGSPGAGPTFQNIWGRSVTVVKDGQEQVLTADAAYLRRATLQPEAEVVKGFDPIMSSYEGQVGEADMQAILDFLEKGDAPQGPDGYEVMQANGCLSCHSVDGSPSAGPTFKGMFDSTIDAEEGGKPVRVKVDRAFVQAKLLDPDKVRVKGFDPMMPPASLKPEELEALLRYMEDLTAFGAQGAAGHDGHGVGHGGHDAAGGQAPAAQAGTPGSPPSGVTAGHDAASPHGAAADLAAPLPAPGAATAHGVAASPPAAGNDHGAPAGHDGGGHRP